MLRGVVESMAVEMRQECPGGPCPSVGHCTFRVRMGTLVGVGYAVGDRAAGVRPWNIP